MQVKHVLIIEGCCNLLIMACKLAVGLTTHSTAIIADAFHSLTDVGNNVVAWFALNQAQQPADNDHPYGHQKYIPLAIFFLATLLVVLAVEVVVTAIERFGEPVEQSFIGLAILMGALLANALLTAWQSYWAKRLASELLAADAKHTFSDVLSSIAIIVGWQLAVSGWPWLDTLFALIMAAIIAYLAYKLFKQSIPILVDSTTVDHRDVKAKIQRLDGVDAIRQVRTRFDGERLIGDIIIVSPSSLNANESHEIADRIERLLAQEFGIADVIVHIEPAPTCRD
ncbi:cation diffusion facilitator family transporter [Alteromonas flava]|uniref:cation diffusion facilitator family transporter n=1 Tax=Alteromonas flava TaxID=2048003 RepID=UPI000C28522F|nr:cation diffusion facilitator family transporter [Alteromonas flava]